MNSLPPTQHQDATTQHRVEFFRLPQPGKRDPYFGLSRGWYYYKAAELGEIRMVSVRQRGALRGVRLVVYDSVADYIRRSAQVVASPEKPALALTQLPINFVQS